MDAITHDPNCPILHGCGFAWQARFGPREWPRQEEEDEEKEEPKDKHKGLCKSTFLYMQPSTGDDKKTFASCAGCRMFLSKIERCSLHGKDEKVGAGDSCGLFVKGKAPEDEVDHIEASVTKEESGFTEGPVKCMNCEYFEKRDTDCLLLRILGVIDYKVKPNGCCNAFSLKGEMEDKE